MKFPRTLTAAVLSVATLSVAGAASADTRWDANHPRQDQVLDRVAHQKARIREERREGVISARQAHRMMRHEMRIARQDRMMAHGNGGYITRSQQKRLNREENHAGQYIPR